MTSSIRKIAAWLYLTAATASTAALPTALQAQDQPYNSIKLYVFQGDTNAVAVLPENLRERLYAKITQLINQTGIAELGYSNFYVVPRFDTIGTFVDDAGIGKIYTTECDLTLAIRNKLYSRSQQVFFSSIARRLTGSATRRQDALINAINSISPRDAELLKFMQQTKEKISAYFQQHCPEVIAEAQQSEKLNDFAKAISLYFSVPSDAPPDCFRLAQSGIKRTYSQYVAQSCNYQLLKLKAYVARAQTTDSITSAFSYDEVMQIIEGLDPASEDCYGEACKLIAKIEGRFDQQQKQAWELKKKSAGMDDADTKKQVRAAVANISIQYQVKVQPSSGSHH